MAYQELPPQGYWLKEQEAVGVSLALLLTPIAWGHEAPPLHDFPQRVVIPRRTASALVELLLMTGTFALPVVKALEELQVIDQPTMAAARSLFDSHISPTEFQRQLEHRIARYGSKRWGRPTRAIDVYLVLSALARKERFVRQEFFQSFRVDQQGAFIPAKPIPGDISSVTSFREERFFAKETGDGPTFDLEAERTILDAHAHTLAGRCPSVPDDLIDLFTDFFMHENQPVPATAMIDDQEIWPTIRSKQTPKIQLCKHLDGFRAFWNNGFSTEPDAQYVAFARANNLVVYHGYTAHPYVLQRVYAHSVAIDTELKTAV